MLSSDLALILMAIVAAIVVGPILTRQIKQLFSSGPSLGALSPRPSLSDLGGLARTPEDRAVVEEFDRLFPSDPIAAQRMLHEHFVNQSARDEAWRAALRDRAQTDADGADQLRRLLRADLDVCATLLKDARKKLRKDPSMQVGVANVEKWQDETQAELTRVNALIRRLHGAA